MIHQDNEGNSALRDDLNGAWYIFQRSFNPIIYPKLK
jgi:hypothetical protein